MVISLVGCSPPTTSSERAGNESTRLSPATVLAGIRAPQLFDVKATVERTLGYEIPEPDQRYPRIGKFVVRSGPGALSSEAKYRFADGHVATVVVREGVAPDQVTGEQVNIGGVAGVSAGDKWSFRFTLQARTGYLNCLVYAVAEVDEEDFARFVASLALN